MKKILVLLSAMALSLFAETTIELNKAQYLPAESIKITLAEMPGNEGDWVGIFPKDKPSVWENVLTWKFDGKVTDGNHTLDGVAVGEYEARVFLNNSYTMLAKKAFSVNAPQNDVVITTKSSYKTNDSIEITLKNMPGNDGDWVGIFPKDKPSVWANVLTWKFDGNVTDGNHSIDGVSAGIYEARVFLNNSYTLLAKTEFTVQEAQYTTTVATSKTTFDEGEKITVTLKNMPGNNGDWVGIFKKDAPDVWENCIAWKFDGEVNDGTYDLDSVVIGEYEVRVFLNNSMNRLATASFTVAEKQLHTKVTTDKDTYVNGEDINVSVEDMLGNQKDWIGIFPVGAESKFEMAYDWEWTEAIHNGSILFHGLPAGEYEVRVFFNNEFIAKDIYAFSVTEVDLPDTILEDAENGISDKWIKIIGDTPAKRATPGANSNGSLVLTPNWEQEDGNWDNGAEYHMPVDFSIQTVLEMDMGGLPKYKLDDDSQKGYMPHYQVGVYIKSKKGDRVMVWDSYFNHIGADAHIADYGNGHIWLQYPSPVEHVRGWFEQSTSGWRHFRVDLESEMHKLEPDNDIIHIYKFYATGGFLDNIKLSSK